MNPRTIGRALGAAACALLFAVSLSARATALYDVSMQGTLTVDSLVGPLQFEQVLTQGASADVQLDPPGRGTASAGAGYDALPVPNSIRVGASTQGTALPSTAPFGTLSFGTGSVGGGVRVTNPGTAPVQLLINVDIDWIWTLLVDSPSSETATAALSLDLYSDGQFVRSLVNLVGLQASGSDSDVETLQLDLTDPDLATLNGGQSRLIALVASVTANAVSVPVPGTLLLVLGGLGVLGLRRRG